MIDWQDEGIVLARRPQGESSAIARIFTRAHGLQSGLVRGGMGKRLSPLLQPGSQLALGWRARLEDQLGTFTIEQLRSRAHLMERPLALAALSAACALLERFLPERAPHALLWAATESLFERLADATDPGADYIRWELALLAETGFALDLSCCAVTGARQGLAFVSPRSGRAVTHEGAGDWADRLLPLPEGLLEGRGLTPEGMSQGLRLTGHFLERARAEQAESHALPDARGRLVDRLLRKG